MRDWMMRLVAGVVLIGAVVARSWADDGAAPALEKPMLEAPAPAPSPAAHEGYERWYVVDLMGKRAGWMHEKQRMDDAGRVVTTTEMEFKLARLNTNIRVAMATRFIETPAGEPVSMTSEQNLGTGAVTQEYTFTPEGILQKSTQGGRTTETKLPLPKETWLTPAEVRQFVEKRIEAGAKEIVYATLDPNTGVKPVTQTHTIIGESTVEALGKTVPAVKWSVTQSVMPGVESIEYVDTRGVPIRTEIDLGGIKMTVLASEKEVALSDFDAPEIMAQTLVKPDRDIPHPRQTMRATYVLSVPSGGGKMPDLPSAGGQRVERIDETSVRVTVDAQTPFVPGAEDMSDPDYALPTSTADSKDPNVMKLVARATKDLPAGATPRERAEAMRVFVNSFIDEKNLGVGFATASEVATTREGDCSEHGVLLTAMLRADGIPARAVSGLIYVDQFMKEARVFGYHMWTQGLLEIEGSKRWVDLDAVLPAGPGFDATHIAISTSDLSDDGVINSMVPLTGVLGRLRIVVESAE